MKKCMIVGLLVCGMTSQNVQAYVREPKFHEVMDALNTYDKNSLSSILNQINRTHSVISAYSSNRDQGINFDEMRKLQTLLVRLQKEYNDLFVSTMRAKRANRINNTTALPTETAQIEQNQDDQNDQDSQNAYSWPFQDVVQEDQMDENAVDTDNESDVE